MTGTVLSAVDDGLRTITLNRPERLNAVNTEMQVELLAALAEGNADPATRAIILRGAGRAFCSGEDLKEFGGHTGDEEDVRAHIEMFQHISREILFGDKMVIAAVHGWAAGDALEWVIDCDLAIFAEGTRCFFPEVPLGVFVIGAVSALLPKMTGPQRAKELILFGEPFDARQALAMGIARQVVPADILFDEAQATARRIIELPGAAVGDLKRVLNRAYHMDVEGAMELETEATVRGFLDPSTAERAARFGGRCHSQGKCRGKT